MKIIKLFVRKNIYGGKGWAFDCDEQGNILGEMMQKGYQEMMKSAQEEADRKNKNISDIFSIFGEVRQMIITLPSE
jgi:hypothetical protein